MSNFDIAVIGAGVAGLNAAVTAARHGLKTVLVDRLGAGGQVITVDRIENLPGPAEGMSGYELGPALHMQADEAGAEFELGEIASVVSTDQGFRISGDELDLEVRSLIIAAGSTKRKLGIPGEDAFEGKGVSHCASCDGPLLRGKDAVVVGGGDSAFDEALALSQHAGSVTVVVRGETPRARASLQAKVEEAGNITVLTGTVVEEIVGDDGVTSVKLRQLDSGVVEEKICHGVFIYIGLEPATSVFRDLVDLDEDGRIAVDLGMRTSRAGVFAAGDIRSQSVSHLAASAGDGVTAAISAVNYLAGENGRA